jgi:tetratricopeptide (TPR) repeat protein
MGRVYRVLDRLSGRVVTLKRLEPESNGNGGGEVAERRVLLAEEFQLLASLRHPNIISVLDYGFDPNQEPYLTMDLEENAHTIIEAGAGRATAIRVDLLVQALRALVYLHRHGIIHRDLKPENILVVGDQVRILDFGLSVLRSSAAAGRVGVAGTLDYMAPELLCNEAPSEHSDLFALGMVAFELLAGRYPFDRTNPIALQRALCNTPLPGVNHDIDPRLRPILARLLALNRASRYHDAREVIRDLGNAIDQPFPVETIATRESLLQAAPFIGRQSEIDRLTAVIAAGAEGRGSAWLIGGESGVGKTRLLDELRTRALVDGVVVVRGQGSQGGGPYHVWRDVLNRLILDVSISDEEASALIDIVPNIGMVLGRQVQPAAAVEPEAAVPRLFACIEEIFRRQPGPILAILEDLQWVGSESTSLWRWLVRAVEGLPVVLLGSFRDDEAARLPAEVPATGVLSLRRLNKEEIGALGEAMMGGLGRQTALVDFLERETEGIPFFIVEVARAMAEERGELSSIGEGHLPASVISGGIQRLIRQRLERVPAGTFRLLETAAVIGRDIDVDLMRTIYPGVDLDSWVGTCTAAAVLEWRDEVWRFAHDKLREQLLADLSPDTQRQLHRKVAHALELTHPEGAEFTTALARHWGAAGEWSKEAQYCEQAGLQALQSGACREAVGFLQRAVEIIEQIEAEARRLQTAAPSFLRQLARIDPNSGIDPESVAFRLGRLEGGLAEACHRLGEMESCLEHGRRALTHFSQYVPTAEPMWTIDVLRQVILRPLQRARGRSRQNADHVRQVAGTVSRVQERMTEAFYYAMQPLQLVWSSLRQVNQAWPAGEEAALAKGNAMIGVLLSVTPGYRLAESWCRSALRIAAASGSPRDRALVLLRAAVVQMSKCDWAAAAESLRIADGLAAEVGDFRLREETAVIETARSIYTGRYQAGLDHIDLALRLARRASDSQIERWSIMGQADLYVRLGRPAEAIERYETGLERIGGKTMKTEIIWGYGMLALARLRTGDRLGAFTAASRSLELIMATQPVAYWMQHGMAATCEVLSTLLEDPHGLDDNARAQLRRFVKQACVGMRRYARRFPLGRPPADLWEGMQAWLDGHPRRALRRWQRCIRQAMELELPYERGRAHFEIARCRMVSDPERLEHLLQAIELFEGLGCSYELGAARAQLPA